MGLTTVTMKEIEMTWAQKLREANQQLYSFNSLHEIVDFLRQKEYHNTISYHIRRYIMNELKTDCDNTCFTVKLSDKSYHFSLVPELNQPCPENELKDYSELLENISKSNGINGQFRFRDIISKNSVPRSREDKFKLTFALGMNVEQVKDFFNVINENPYNIRNPYEVIYYFCQSRSYNWKKQQELRNRYDSLPNDNIADIPSQKTSVLYNKLDSIISNTIPLTDTQREQALLEFLKKSSASFSGYSITARNIFCDLLEEIRQNLNSLYQEFDSEYFSELDESKRTQIEKDKFSALERAMYSGCPCRISGHREFKKFDLEKMPEDITINWLNRGRMGDLVKGNKPVTRKDLLFLLYYKYPDSKEYEAREKSYSEADRLQNIKDYIKKINRILKDCNFRSLYAPNQFDRLILLALYSDDPVVLFDEVIKAAYE